MIVLNGGSYYPESECLDNEWIKHIGNDDLIGFIPSATTRSEKTYFEFFKEKMRNYNLTNIVMVDLYNDWSVLRETKVIYIAGGNTYKLLEIMNVSGFTN